MHFLFDGYLIVIFVYTIRLRKILKYHFWMDGGFRVDDTPVHRALREALANCIINTDFMENKQWEEIRQGYIACEKNRNGQGNI